MIVESDILIRMKPDYKNFGNNILI